MVHTVAVLVGSLRRDSLNRKLAQALAKLAQGRLDLRISEIGDLPMYNEDLWENPPEPVLRMKRDVEAAQGVLFVTPEYNRYFTPSIKNAIDWGTRPWGQSSWTAKPAAIVGTSPGAIGTAAAQNSLRNLLVVCDMVLMGQPEVYLAYKDGLFGEDGSVTSEETAKFLDGFIDRFAAWIERNCPPRTDAEPNPALVNG